MNLDRLFRPDSIAVVGASATEGKLGHEAMASAVGFDGPVYPVNPSGEGRLFGEPFAASIGDVDDRVDLALLAVPAQVVPEVLAECGAADVGAAIVYAGGFAEAGEEGRRRQAEIATLAETHDIAVLGPNTSGFVAPGRRLVTSFAGGFDRLDAGDVTILAQSGGVAHQLAFHAHREGRGVATMVGLGNRVTVGFEETIPYFDADPDTAAIVLHVEGTDTGRALCEACGRADTPIVAYKVGRADVGEFAASHTGALTGEHALYTAGFAQYGVPTVEDTTALFDAGVALARAPPPSGPNVGVVTAQAGPGIIIADRLQRRGASLPELTASTRERIDDLLPDITYTANPVDTGRPLPSFGDVVDAVATDDNVDIVLVSELFEEALGYPIEVLDGLPDRVDKPVVVATEGTGPAMADEIRALREAGLTTVTTPERGADVAGALARWARLNGGEGTREVTADGG